MTGYCVSGCHVECPDSLNDSYGCECSCHLINDELDDIEMGASA